MLKIKKIILIIKEIILEKIHHQKIKNKKYKINRII